jgi:acetyltransferase
LLHGAVLRDNEPMIKLCRDLGFTVEDDPEDPMALRAVLPLARAAGPPAR